MIPLSSFCRVRSRLSISADPWRGVSAESKNRGRIKAGQHGIGPVEIRTCEIETSLASFIDPQVAAFRCVAFFSVFSSFGCWLSVVSCR
jgi:hypothetical protein